MNRFLPLVYLRAKIGKRLIKSPKLYFLDSGLLCFLLGIRGEDENGNPCIRRLRFPVLISLLARGCAEHPDLSYLR